MSQNSNLEAKIDCGDCGESGCEEVGKVHRIDIVKSYCCRCYGLIDPEFTPDHWCDHCMAKKNSGVVSMPENGKLTECDHFYGDDGYTCEKCGCEHQLSKVLMGIVDNADK